jgi:hypothetical protein
MGGGSSESDFMRTLAGAALTNPIIHLLSLKSIKNVSPKGMVTRSPARKFRLKELTIFFIH